VDITANGYDSIIPTMFESFPPVLLSLVIVLVLAASMSTLSSIVLTSSTTLTLDLNHELKGGKLEEKKQIGMIRGLILIFILLSAVIAILQYKFNIAFIAQLMGLSWGAMAGAFLGPFLYGLYSKRVTVPAVWTSFIFGVGLMLLNMFFKAAFPAWLQSPINCGAFVMLASLVLVPAVSALTQVKDAAKVEDIFSCYEMTVTVPARASIGYSAPAKKRKKK
jgi:Na+/pantothenate symporter